MTSDAQTHMPALRTLHSWDETEQGDRHALTARVLCAIPWVVYKTLLDEVNFREVKMNEAGNIECEYL